MTDTGAAKAGEAVVATRPRVLWACPHCRRTFASVNQTHTCRQLGHLVLARSVDSPRFRRIEIFSTGNVLHAFRLVGPDEVDDEFAGWPQEAYAVGEQRHLERHRRIGK